MGERLISLYTYAVSLLSKAGRRYSDSLRDAGSFINQVEIVRRVLPEWQKQARNLDENQVEAALEILNEVRAGLRQLTREMVAGEGHLQEAGEVGATLLNRLATGAHLTQPENLEYLIKGDSEGLAQYLNLTEQATLKRALLKVSSEQKVMLLELLLRES